MILLIRHVNCVVALFVTLYWYPIGGKQWPTATFDSCLKGVKAGLADCFRIIHRAKIPSLIHLLFRRPCFESYYMNNETDFPSNLFCYKQQYVHSDAKPVFRLMIDFCLSNAKKALVFIKRAPEIIRYPQLLITVLYKIVLKTTSCYLDLCMVSCA